MNSKARLLFALLVYLICSAIGFSQKEELRTVINEAIEKLTPPSLNNNLINEYNARLSTFPQELVTAQLIEEIKQALVFSKREKAIVKLLRAQGDAATPMLVRSLNAEQDAANRVKLMHTFNQGANDSVIKALARLLDDPRWVTDGRPWSEGRPFGRIDESAYLGIMWQWHKDNWSNVYLDFMRLHRPEKEKVMAEMRERILGKNRSPTPSPTISPILSPSSSEISSTSPISKPSTPETSPTIQENRPSKNHGGIMWLVVIPLVLLSGLGFFLWKKRP